MRVLGEFHDVIGRLVKRFDATVGFLEGDGVQLFFNDPIEIPDAALRAVQLGCALREEMAALKPVWAKRGHELDVGIGIALGYATCGEVGFDGRSDYAAIGAVTNLAARLADEATGGQVLIAQRLYAEVDQDVDVVPVGEFTLEGVPAAGRRIRRRRRSLGDAGAVPAVGRRPGWRIGGSRRWRSRSSDFVARSRSCARRGRGSCWPRTPTAARSSASSTTARSRTWSRSRSSCSRPAAGRPPIPPQPAPSSTRCSATSTRRWTAAGAGAADPSSSARGGRPPRCPALHRSELGVRAHIDVAATEAIPSEHAGNVYFCCVDALERFGERNESSDHRPRRERDARVRDRRGRRRLGHGRRRSHRDARSRGGARRPVDDRVGVGAHAHHRLAADLG